jgi:hypothetical protein
MKAHRREDVEIRWYTDDKFDGTRIEKNRHIYRRKDGAEYITGFGDVTRGADGKLFVERRCKTIQPININDWIKKVKETGGSVVILPP